MSVWCVSLVQISSLQAACMLVSRGRRSSTWSDRYKKTKKYSFTPGLGIGILSYYNNDVMIKLWVLLDRPSLSVATPPIFTATPPYTKDASFSSALNYFGML